MMHDEAGMSLLAAETERWHWHQQFYVQCERCALYGHRDDEFTHDREGEVCNSCVEADWKEGALSAGIPLDVIEGRSKLSDHFSPDYIAFKSGKPVNEENDDE